MLVAFGFYHKISGNMEIILFWNIVYIGVSPCNAKAPPRHFFVGYSKKLAGLC